MTSRVGSIGPKLLPPLLALTVLWLGPALSATGRSRETLLPLATLTFLVAMLHPRLRRFVVVTLCFFVCFYMIQERHRIDQLPLPDALQYDLIDAARPLLVWSIGALAALAGVGELVWPGAEWARRCYFGGATLFFVGLGVYDYGCNRSSRSIVLCVTGIVALLLCVFAHKLGSDVEGPEGVESTRDEGVQAARDAAHRDALQSKEWRDSIVQGIEDGNATLCDRSPTRPT